jgi:hypothetical protein
MLSKTMTLVVKLLLHSDFTALGRLLDSHAEIAVDSKHIWVRYQSDDERAAGVAHYIHGQHFRLLENKLLVPLGSSVATERLPELDWRELEKAIEFKLPAAALSGRLTAAELPELKLLRGGAERPASAGLYSLDELIKWVVAAPQFRLQKLAACVAEYEVLVIGNPLPPIACEYLCQDGRLLTPAGMTWYPRIDAESVLEHFDVAKDQILLWTKTDEWSSIPIDIVKPLRRGSIRAFDNKQRFEQRV